MFDRRKLDDFSDELRAHLDLEQDRLREEGLDETEAGRRARLNLGNLMQQQERFYESSRWAWLEQLRQDIRYAFRQLRNAPGFTLTATLTLAIGIGATAAIFTLINAVLLKSLPVTRPAELYIVGEAKAIGVRNGLSGDWDLFPYDLYAYFRDNTSGFRELAAFQSDVRRVSVRRQGDAGGAVSLGEEYVSGNYFSTLGAPMATGRAIGVADDRPGAAPVAVLAYRTWAERYGSDPSVVGAAFLMNGTAVTIAGVAAEGFFGDTLRANPPDLWMPIADEAVVHHGGWRDNPRLGWLHVIGRIDPQTDARAVEAQVQTELRQWLTSQIGLYGPGAAQQIPRQRVRLQSGAAGTAVMRSTYSDGLRLLMLIAGFVLLIVCANLANLMLVRGLARRRQTAISLALGAARGRIVRQALTESLVIALIGGIAGVGIAFAATRSLLAAVFTGVTALPVSSSPDLTVLAFALALSLATGMIFGIAPAWSARRTDPLEAMRSGGRSSSNSGSILQRSLVVAQAALSLALLASAGLLTESLRNISHQPFGFAPGGRVAVRIDSNLGGHKLDQLEPLYHRIVERMEQLPGVVHASYALYTPMSGSGWSTDVYVDGQAPPKNEGDTLSFWDRVGPNYFETVGTPILRGRPILESDHEKAPRVAVINEAFARRFFPHQDPIGQHLGPLEGYEKTYEIVGVVASAKYRDPDQPVVPMYFLSRPQMTHYDNPGTLAFETRSMYAPDIVIHFAAMPASVEALIRNAFAEVDPNLSVVRIQSFDAQVAGQVSQESLIVRLTAIFGLTALLLASIGLYGVSAYSVAQRSREIGIRVALGADRASVVTMVLRRAYVLVGIGLAMGIPLALALGRLIGSKLYQVNWYSPIMLGGAALTLVICALAANFAPARRAASIDAIETLREI